MAMDRWLRVLNTVGGLAAVSERLLSRRPADSTTGSTSGGLGELETRLAGVVVAALKEAFDRDRARLDLERSHLDADERRADEALRLELSRQAADRAVGEVRLLGVMSLAIWITSAVLIVALPDVRNGPSKWLLGFGWSALIGSLACAVAAHRSIGGWLAGVRSGNRTSEQPQALPVSAVGWLLVTGLGLTAASLIIAL
jgi:hypothetical protein